MHMKNGDAKSLAVNQITDEGKQSIIEIISNFYLDGYSKGASKINAESKILINT